MKQVTDHIRNSQGVSLVMVLVVLMVISIIAVSILGASSNNLVQSTGEERVQSAFYIAEGGLTVKWAGIEDVLAESAEGNADDFLCRFHDGLDRLTADDVRDFAPHGINEPAATVTWETDVADCRTHRDAEPATYILISEGVIGDRSRTVEKSFTLAPGEGGGFQLSGKLSLYTDKTITLLEGAVINGNVASNSSAASTIRLDGGARISENIYVPDPRADTLSAPAYMKGDYTGRVIEGDGPYSEHVMPEFPAIPSYQMMADTWVGGQYNRFKIIDNGNLNVTSWQANSYTLNLHSDTGFRDVTVTQNNTLTINVGSENRSISVDNLNLSNGHIQVQGTGKLSIHVRDNLSFGSGSFNMANRTEQLEILLKGTPAGQPKKHIQIASNMRINGSLFAENADLTFTGGGGFLGHVVTGGDRVTLSGGSRVGESVIFAPHALVRMDGGGSMKGAIISDSFLATGGSILSYAEIGAEEVPFLGGGGSASGNYELGEERPMRER